MRQRGPLPRNFWTFVGFAAFLVFCFRLGRNALSGPTKLRILPLGDSLTEGHGSSDDNGYRLFLWNLLIESGHSVEFVGSKSAGYNNLNPAHEGWHDAKIHEVASSVALHGGLRTHPNIILLHVGTGDVKWDDENPPAPGQELEYAHYRLTILLDEILCENPDTVILVAKIVGQPGNQERVDWFNYFVNDTLTPYRERGSKIKMVDHSGVGQGNGYDLVDGIHPNDAGYHKMALQWFRTIHHLPEDWIKPAKRPAKTPKDRKCQHDDQYWYELNHKGMDDIVKPAAAVEEAEAAAAAAAAAEPESQAGVVGSPSQEQIGRLDPAAVVAADPDTVAPVAQPGVGMAGLIQR